MSKIYMYVAGFVLICAGFYFAIVKPRIDLEKSEEVILIQEKKLESIDIVKDAEAFEDKYKTIKYLKPFKEVDHAEINLSSGTHIIVFD